MVYSNFKPEEARHFAFVAPTHRGGSTPLALSQPRRRAKAQNWHEPNVHMLFAVHRHWQEMHAWTRLPLPPRSASCYGRLVQ